MKCDWFGIISKKFDLPLNESVAFEIDLLFKKLIYQGLDEDGNILFRTMYDDTIYKLIVDKNMIVIEYKYKLEDEKNEIKSVIKIYRGSQPRADKKGNVGIEKRVVLHSNSEHRKTYKHHNYKEILKRRTKYFLSDLVIKDKETFFENCSIYYEGITIPEVKSMYITPDVVTGVFGARDASGTHATINDVFQAFNTRSDFSYEDNTYPLIAVCDYKIYNSFSHKYIDDDTTYFKKDKKRKIGF